MQLIFNGLRDGLNQRSHCISAREKRKENTSSSKCPIKSKRGFSGLPCSNRGLYSCYWIGRGRSLMKGYYSFPYNHITLLQNQGHTQHNKSFLSWGLGESWAISQSKNSSTGLANMWNLEVLLLHRAKMQAEFPEDTFTSEILGISSRQSQAEQQASEIFSISDKTSPLMPFAYHANVKSCKSRKGDFRLTLSLLLNPSSNFA